MSTLSQRSFTAGELSKSLYAGVDLAKYAAGLKKCRNFYVMRHGGVTNRPGSEYICEVKDSSKTVRLIEFIFNTTQTYVLEFGDQYMRVIKDGVQVKHAAQNITGVTNANPCVITYDGADNYSNGEYVYVDGINGTLGTFLNKRTFIVSNVNTVANTFEVKYTNGTNVNSTSFGSWSSGGTLEKIYEISTPYVEADLPMLKYVQSADVVTIVHASYAPRKLERTGDTSWTLSTISFVPQTSTPTGLTLTQINTTGSTTRYYKVTAIDDETLEESLPTSAASNSQGLVTKDSASPLLIEWTNVSGASTYNIYEGINGIYGLIGISSGSSFFDIGAVSADTTTTPPSDRGLFASSNNYPSAITYFQQRLMLANTNNKIENIYTSKIGNFYNFTASRPIQDDDAITFNLAGRQVNAIHHLIDIGSLIVFTESGEWSIQGDTAGILTPGNINPKQYSYNGSSSKIRPLVIGNTAIYLQARGNIVRDLGYDFSADGYKGNDLTLFSSHLFDKYQIVDWTYQQTPHSILWAVRDDGTMVGMTYVREQNITAWHRHDFENGTAENVCTVPSGSEDALYVVIKRTINGETKRYIEKLSTRKINDIVDSKIIDSHYSIDGRNLNTSHGMTLSGGTDWVYTETLTLTSSASYFTSSDVGKEIHLTGSDGSIIRFSINAYSSATVVTGKANKTVPAAMRSVSITDWSIAVKTINNLWHLEGDSVSIFADGFVVGNPNNSSYDVFTVTNGSITLPRPYSVIHIGIPITSDLQNLNIDTANGETIADKKNIIQKVTMFLEDSRGVWIGSEEPNETINFLNGLYEAKIRGFESYDAPVSLTTGTIDVSIQSTWNSNGSIFIRQTDPVPLTVLSIMPSGYFPFRG